MLEGTIHPDYAEVASSLRRAIPRTGHGGAAVCVYHRGHCVVDLWGGTRDGEGSPWCEDTVCLSFSTTKGVASTLLHILVDQGRAAYDDPVARHWPEFGTQGKDSITVRQLLCHEAGLYRIAEMVERPAEMLDWEHMTQAVANAAPVHAPGATHGYHGLTYGWLIGGLVESIAERPFQRVLREELIEPLNLEGMFIGMPAEAMTRRAKLRDVLVEPPSSPTDDWRATLKERIEEALAVVGIELPEFRASMMPFSEAFDWNDDAGGRCGDTGRQRPLYRAVVGEDVRHDRKRRRIRWCAPVVARHRSRDRSGAKSGSRQGVVRADAVAFGLSPCIRSRCPRTRRLRPLWLRQ